ncbi:MAG: Ankyrin repeats (3 copies) [Candidatus Dependentiae bacterium ADurb.Bin331]|nr:MAG: Ankyrin repeats (3 copies) [Candidatus Dependentiae bacterium ADurb.Bin331]
MNIIISIIASCVFIVQVTSAMSSSQELVLAIKNKHPLNKNIQQLIRANQPNAHHLYEQFLQEKGMTPLSYATEKGKWNVVSFFLKQQIDPNLLSTKGNLPLCKACYYLQPSLVNELLSRGADINGVDAFGRTALHSIVSADEEIFCSPIQFALFKNVLRKGAGPNMQDCEGNTPLHELIHGYINFKTRVKKDQQAHLETSFNKMVKWLLYCGARYDLENTTKKTALSIGTEKVRTFLISKRSELLITMTKLLIRCGFNKDIAGLIIAHRYK